MKHELNDVLESLPTQKKSACKDCGSTDWSSCNQHPDGGFYECDRCTAFDLVQQKLVRRNLQ